MKPVLLNVDRVAIAGADESVRPEQLAEVSRKYPFVEWSVLYSSTERPLNGFPSVEWLRELVEQSKQFQSETGRPLNLSIHLCGMAVKGLIRGEFETLEPVMDLLPHFQRMQLNAIFKRLAEHLALLPENLRRLPCRPQIIIQLNGKPENDAVSEMLRDAGFDTVRLHDRSSGQGLEHEWLPPVGSYCGYAGGLKPETLEKNLPAIAQAAEGQRIYLDLQSGVRDENDHFVLERAEEVLKLTQDWIDQTS